MHMAMPRSGHVVQQLYRMLGYLKLPPKRKIAYDRQHPAINGRMFKRRHRTDFFRDIKEAVARDMSAPCGDLISTHCFVDASPGRVDHVTRRSKTGILIFFSC